MNVNGLSASKRMELVESLGKGTLNFMEVHETHIKGCGMMECMMGSESEV